MFNSITGENLFTGQQFYLTNELLATRKLQLMNPVFNQSESVYWNGMYLARDNYSISNNTVSINEDIPLKYWDAIYVQYAIGE